MLFQSLASYLSFGGTWKPALSFSRPYSLKDYFKTKALSLSITRRYALCCKSTANRDTIACRRRLCSEKMRSNGGMEKKEKVGRQRRCGDKGDCRLSASLRLTLLVLSGSSQSSLPARSHPPRCAMIGWTGTILSITHTRRQRHSLSLFFFSAVSKNTFKTN